MQHKTCCPWEKVTTISEYLASTFFELIFNLILKDVLDIKHARPHNFWISGKIKNLANDYQRVSLTCVTFRVLVVPSYNFPLNIYSSVFFTSIPYINSLVYSSILSDITHLLLIINLRNRVPESRSEIWPATSGMCKIWHPVHHYSWAHWL